MEMDTNRQTDTHTHTHTHTHTLGPQQGEETTGCPAPCGTKGLGIIMVSKYVVGCGRLACTQSHGDIWSWAATKGHVWVCGPAAALVCVNAHGSC